MGIEPGLSYLSRGSDLEDCYHAGDGFVFASRTETQGLVLLEAMALRTRGLHCCHGCPGGSRRW